MSEGGCIPPESKGMLEVWDGDDIPGAASQ